MQKAKGEYENLEDQVSKAIKIVKELKAQQQKTNLKSRFMIGVCGIPGSGKSTVSLLLSSKLQNSVVLPMDGFHLRRNQLTEQGLIRRGAAFTFDLAKFEQKMMKIKECHIGQSLKYPSFSHEEKDPVQDAIQIKPSTEVIIVEGLYVLDGHLAINQKNEGLGSFWDFRIWVQSQIEVAIESVAKRHVESGIEPNYELAYQRANSNDRTNAIYVQENCWQVEKFVSADIYDIKIHKGMGVTINNSVRLGY